jgi:GTP-binding protein
MRVVEAELEAYGDGLEDKPRLVALNKIDLSGADLAEDYAAELIAAGADRVFPISGATRQGVEELMDAVLSYLPSRTATENPHVIPKAEDDDDDAAEPVWDPLG